MPTHPISEKKLDVAALVERLRARRSLDIGSAPSIGGKGKTLQEPPSLVEWDINPDGPEAAHKIEALTKKVDELEAREERVREALFTLSDRLRRIGALDSDNVHAAYEAVVTALNDTTQCRESDNG